MERIESEQISALLDGELTAAEAAEVRCAIEMDEELAREFRRLSHLDNDLRAYARALQFRPAVAMPEPQAARRPSTALLVCGLVLLRVGLKAVPLPVAGATEVAVLVLVLAWGLGHLVRASDRERDVLAHRLAGVA